mmetsp:Transcript_18358/g.52527  ORF Transcript_18358/g.52527 Transcript_18358/m.52527 type:complete len:428 (+) Transcript_18358:101-1384(+)
MPETESGFAKLCNSILCAICGAPLVLLGASYLLGWNERTAVCQTRAIDAANEEVEELGCDSTKDGTLVMFACDMKRDGLDIGDHWEGFHRLNNFLPGTFEYTGTGLEVSVEMLQCVEHQHTSEHERSDGTKVKTTTYSYAMEWVGHHVDTMSFHEKHGRLYKAACGTVNDNPAWPHDTPQGTTSIYAPKVQVGAYTLDQWAVKEIPIDAPVHLTHFKAGWDPAGTGVFQNALHTAKSQHLIAAHQPGADIGLLKVKFFGTDWSRKKLTVLGHGHAGRISKWTAPSSWLCEGYQVWHISRRAIEKEDLFQEFHDTADTTLLLLRIVGFCLMWLGWFMFGKPLGAFADMIPLCGPCLGDAIDAITCAVSCMPATACCLLVAGVVWVVMRPLVGGPMLLGAVAIIAFMIYQKMQAQPKTNEQQPLNNANE